MLYNVDTVSVLDVETTLKQHRNNVDTILYQPCFNVASTLVRTTSNSIWLVMIIDLLVDE